MASDIHRQRTGRGFKLTEEIVLKGDMYEEEDDVFPHRRALRGLPVDAAIAAAAAGTLPGSVPTFQELEDLRQRESTVNAMFAEHFPYATQTHQHQHTMYVQAQHMLQLQLQQMEQLQQQQFLQQEQMQQQHFHMMLQHHQEQPLQQYPQYQQPQQPQQHPIFHSQSPPVAMSPVGVPYPFVPPHPGVGSSSDLSPTVYGVYPSPTTSISPGQELSPGFSADSDLSNGSSAGQTIIGLSVVATVPTDVPSVPLSLPEIDELESLH
ncbi:hypothetical protein SPI_06051 [Niveomyces insectorum RCEF 264]|uniref:Uncharacterized protein n=1 Tax=Niveomyces insectorum RCEF 264 TaxID=1081102 RepID=A0A167SR60_9HYPO|nr:hypothetical protein SPI_06051 [Niveomyces insectorum RCEF 264]